MLLDPSKSAEKISTLVNEACGFTLEEKTNDDFIVLTGKKPIRKEAYLGVRRKKYATFEITLSKSSVAVSVTADDLFVSEDPFCYRDYKTEKAFHVSDDRKKLVAKIPPEDFMIHGVETVIEKMEALELSMDMNIRIYVTNKNEEKFLAKQAMIQTQGLAEPDLEVFQKVTEIVLADMKRRFCSMVRKYKRQRIKITNDTAETAMRSYFADIMLEFEMEKDDHVSKKFLHDILYDYRKLGNPVPKCTNIYAIDGLTAGQWIYCYYYAIKGEAWFDYATYCSKYDRLEEELLEAAFRPYMKKEGDDNYEK